MEKTIHITVDKEPYSYRVQGSFDYGAPGVLFEKEDSLLEGATWSSKGYIAERLDRYDFQSALYSWLTRKIQKKLEINSGSFYLEQYHKWFSSDDDHFALMNKMKMCFDIEELPFRYDIIENIVSELCGTRLSLKSPDFGRIFCIRIVRPFKNDNNPVHKDVWLPRLKNAVNLYFPICGSNENSSLSLIPGSHLVDESLIERTADSAVVNGLRFSVPCVTKFPGGIKLVRPKLSEGSFLLFTPYMLHGGAFNANSNETRFSLEMRFFKAV